MARNFVIWVANLAALWIFGVAAGIVFLDPTSKTIAVAIGLIMGMYVPGKLGDGWRAGFAIAAVALSLYLVDAGNVAFAFVSIVTGVSLWVIDLPSIIPLPQLDPFSAKSRNIPSSPRR